MKKIDASAQPNEVYAKVREAFGDALPVLKSEAEPIAETTGLPLVLTEISGAEGCEQLIDRNSVTSFESKSDTIQLKIVLPHVTYISGFAIQAKDENTQPK